MLSETLNCCRRHSWVCDKALNPLGFRVFLHHNLICCSDTSLSLCSCNAAKIVLCSSLGVFWYTYLKYLEERRKPEYRTGGCCCGRRAGNVSWEHDALVVVAVVGVLRYCQGSIAIFFCLFAGLRMSLKPFFFFFFVYQNFFSFVFVLSTFELQILFLLLHGKRLCYCCWMWRDFALVALCEVIVLLLLLYMKRLCSSCCSVQEIELETNCCTIEGYWTFFLCKDWAFVVKFCPCDLWVFRVSLVAKLAVFFSGLLKDRVFCRQEFFVQEPIADWEEATAFRNQKWLVIPPQEPAMCMHLFPYL